MKYLRRILFLWVFFSLSTFAGDTGPFSPLTFNEGIEFKHPKDLLMTRMQFRIQNRIEYKTLEGDNGSADAMEWKTRRMRLKFGGYVYNPKYKYNVQLSFSRDDIDYDETDFPHVIRDATFIYQLSDRWELSFGMSKLPGNRQRLVSSRNLQFVDRSLVNSTFNLDRDFGIQSYYHRESDSYGDFRWNAALSGGEGRNGETSDAGVAVTSRLEWLPLGSFKDGGEYVEGDLARNPHFRLALAVGGSHNQNSFQRKVFHDTPLSESRNVTTSFADMMMKYRGWSLLAEYFKRDVEGDPFVFDQNNNQTYFYQGEGLNIQSGIFVAKRSEIALRYSIIEPHELIEAEEGRHQQYTLAYSYYIKGHRLKVQTDFSYDYEEASLNNTSRKEYLGRLQLEIGI